MDFEEAIEKRAKQLIELNAKYDGKVAKMIDGISLILKEYTEESEKVLNEGRVKSKKSPNLIMVVNEDTLKKLNKIEEEETERLNKLMSGLPPDLREALV